MSATPSYPLHVVLIGPMAVGKTSIGRIVAKQLLRPLIDSDAVIEATVGMSGREYAEAHGLNSLHDLELTAFLEMAISPDPAVVTPAESVIDTAHVRDVLADLFTVWLQADANTLLARRDPSDHRRHMTTEELQSRAESRATHLSACSRLMIRTDRINETQAANEIVNAFRSR